MFCTYCGKKLAPGATFCTYCGKKLKSVNEGAQAPKTSQQPVPQPKEPQPEKKKSVAWIIIPLVAGTLVVALTVFGGIWVARRVRLGGLGIKWPTTIQGQTQDVIPQVTISVPEWTDRTDVVATEQTTAPVETEATTVPEETQYDPYREFAQTHGDYVLPGSSDTYLGRGDIANLDEMERMVATQEIYARHGQVASDPDLQAYFEKKSWYTRQDGAAELNECEEANLMLLRVFEEQEDGSLYYKENPYPALLTDADAYMLDVSDDRFLTYDDVKYMTLEQLQVARNEIYARHGYIFGYDEMAEYFYTKNWYDPSVLHEDFDDRVFTEHEKLNLDFILAYEKRLKGVSFSSSNPYKDYYSAYRDYYFPQSSYSHLSEEDLYDLDVQECILAKYEIFARYGYTFKDADLLEYFLHYSWYNPNTPCGKTELVYLNSVEQANYNLLEQRQEVLENMPNIGKLDGTLNYRTDCDAFYMTLPAYWWEWADIKVNGNSISFYEKISKASGYGGHLFTVAVYSNEEEYASHPSYRVLSVTADSQGNNKYLVVLEPTDVQFSSVAMELYTRMAQDQEAILATIGLY